jgi:phage gp45-like
MKTIILTIALFTATILGTTKTTFAADKNTDKSTTVLTEVSNISAIEIRGNVELYVSNGTTDQVKVYNQYYSDNAMVQDEKGVLRIASYSAQKLTVWVTANQLQKLSVYDNATVKSFGKLSAINLDVQLYNNASAQLDVDAFDAAITLNNNAKANLSGNVTEGTIKYEQASLLNTTNLKAAHMVKTEKTYAAVKSDDINEIAAL